MDVPRKLKAWLDRLSGQPEPSPAKQEPGDELGQVDLVFVVDVTGSMGPFIGAAREHMTRTLQALTAGSATPIDLWVGVVEYRDHPPQDSTFVTRAHPFTGDLGQAQKTIDKLLPGGGGDGPEAVFDGLRAACVELDWRPHSRRLAVLVGDAPPHGVGARGDGFPAGCPCGLTPDSATALLEEHNIILHALGLAGAVPVIFSRLARYTGGDYFAAGQGQAAINTLKQILMTEFGELDFDRKVRALCAASETWTVDEIAQALDCGRARVSASLSRLGRRGLLNVPGPHPVGEVDDAHP